MIGKLEIFNMVVGKICNSNLKRLYYSNSSFCIFVKLLADTVFQKSYICHTVCLCNTAAFNKVKYSSGRITSSAKSLQGWHSGVVPAVNITCFNKLAKIALTHNGICHIKTCKFILMRLMLKPNVINNPVIEGTVVFKFNRAQGMCNPFKCVLNGVGKVIHRIYAPLITLTVMIHMKYAVNNRVTHIHIR